MYRDSIRSNAHVLAKFSSKELRKILRQQDTFSQKRGMVCASDYDMLWQSQDPDYQEKLSYVIDSQGRVQVHIGARAKVTYPLVCHSGRCKIDDVIDHQGSIRQRISKECR